MSRREYKTINRRMQSGRLASVREGKYVGNIAPFGYDVSAPDQKKATLETKQRSECCPPDFFSVLSAWMYDQGRLSLINDCESIIAHVKLFSFTYSSIHDI